MAVTLKIAAEIALANGDAATAEEYASASYDMNAKAARNPNLSANVGYALLLLGKARLMLDQDLAARDDLRLAEQALTNGLGKDHPNTLEARELLEQQQ